MDKLRHLKATRQKWPILCKRYLIKLTVSFWSETSKPEGSGMRYLKCGKKKNLSTWR
jgi:hypothetical protein